MLKEAQTEEERFFCHVFIIGGISIGGDRPPGYVYGCASDKRVSLLTHDLFSFSNKIFRIVANASQCLP